MQTKLDFSTGSLTLKKPKNERDTGSPTIISSLSGSFNTRYKNLKLHRKNRQGLKKLPALFKMCPKKPANAGIFCTLILSFIHTDLCLLISYSTNNSVMSC